MKKLSIPAVFALALCFSAPAFGITDAEYTKFMKTSKEFKAADDALNSTWKTLYNSLSPEHRKVLKEEQRNWQAYRPALESLAECIVGSRVSACKYVVESRTEYLKRWIPPVDTAGNTELEKYINERRHAQYSEFIKSWDRRYTEALDSAKEYQKRCASEHFGGPVSSLGKIGAYALCDIHLAQKVGSDQFIALYMPQEDLKSAGMGDYYYDSRTGLDPFTIVLKTGERVVLQSHMAITEKEYDKVCNNNKIKEAEAAKGIAELARSVRQKYSSYAKSEAKPLDTEIQGQYTWANFTPDYANNGEDNGVRKVYSHDEAQVRKIGDEYNVVVRSTSFNGSMGSGCVFEITAPMENGRISKDGLEVWLDGAYLKVQIDEKLYSSDMCYGGHTMAKIETYEKNYITDLYDAMAGKY